MVKITLVKSLIACKPAQKANAESLGLKKIGDSSVQNESAALEGKLAVIGHLVKVEKVEQ